MDTQEPIVGFTLLMPEAGARAVIDFTASKPFWYAGYSFRDDYSMWFQTTLHGHELLYGESIVFTLVTPADVPTSWTYIPPGLSGNWDAGGGFHSGSLPVPVPEPSSLAAVLIGLVAILRRRIRR